MILECAFVDCYITCSLVVKVVGDYDHKVDVLKKFVTLC